MFDFIRKRKAQKDRAEFPKRESVRRINSTTRVPASEAAVRRQMTRDVACQVPEENNYIYPISPEGRAGIARSCSRTLSTESLTIRNPFRRYSSVESLASSSRNNLFNTPPQRTTPVESMGEVSRKHPLVVNPHGELGHLAQRAEVLFAGVKGEYGLSMRENSLYDHDTFDTCYPEEMDFSSWRGSSAGSPAESEASSPMTSRASSLMMYPVDFLQVKIPQGVFTPSREPTQNMWSAM